ncbi:MAG: protein translocase subunit SecF [Spirochaetaceae bacterium]|nr:protein translocase subunit SecF [Spirochaetaceae bacterium]
MKRVFPFSKYIVPAVVLSAVLILSGLIPLLTKGINFGIDFKPGLVTEVRLVEPVMELTYNGAASVAVEINPWDVTLVISGVGAENETRVYPFAEYATVGDMAAAMSGVEGVSAKAITASIPADGLFANSAVASVLSSVPYDLYYSGDGQLADAEAVRNALAGLEDVSVKVAGEGAAEVFQIRIGDSGDGRTSMDLQKSITDALAAAFGGDNVAIIKTDFIGAQFSGSLVLQSVLLVVAALFLIWIYATIRFKWDFALASVIAITHDSLVIISFIAWSQMEFNTVTLAAILTIIGYGINDTVVVLDRVRENTRIMNTKNFMDIVNQSQSDCFGRTMITTITTLLAVTALCIFTTGSIHDFALALIVGIISSAYSTIMITSAFLFKTRKNWKPDDEVKDLPRQKGDVIAFPDGSRV